MCRDFPDVGYCMLSQSISLSLMAAQQPVSLCCFFCLGVVKCRSKHKGERKLIIAFDTCCEAEQLFVTGGQPLSFLPFLLQISTDLSFQPLLSRKLSFSFLGSVTFWRIQTCGMFFFYVFCFDFKQYLKIPIKKKNSLEE